MTRAVVGPVNEKKNQRFLYCLLMQLTSQAVLNTMQKSIDNMTDTQKDVVRSLLAETLPDTATGKNFDASILAR